MKLNDNFLTGFVSNKCRLCKQKVSIKFQKEIQWMDTYIYFKGAQNYEMYLSYFVLHIFLRIDDFFPPSNDYLISLFQYLLSIFLFFSASALMYSNLHREKSLM